MYIIHVTAQSLTHLTNDLIVVSYKEGLYKRVKHGNRQLHVRVPNGYSQTTRESTFEFHDEYTHGHLIKNVLRVAFDCSGTLAEIVWPQCTDGFFYEHNYI